MDIFESHTPEQIVNQVGYMEVRFRHVNLKSKYLEVRIRYNMLSVNAVTWDLSTVA